LGYCKKFHDLLSCPYLVVDQQDVPPVLSVRLRSMYNDCCSKNDEEFAQTLQEILQQSGSTRKVQRVKGDAVPDLAVSLLLTSGADSETRRIAQLMQTLASLKDRVQYSAVKETVGEQVRFICIIHIFFDKTFQKIRRHKENDAMDLFRGFVVELLEEEDTVASAKRTESKTTTTEHRRAPHAQNDFFVLHGCSRTWKTPVNLVKAKS
jgi:hypothetical protein